MVHKQKSQIWRLVIYRIAKWAWLITVWIAIAFLGQLIPNLLTLPDPVTSLPHTWTGMAVNWLRTPSGVPIQEILRVIALTVVLLLVAIPPSAFLLKQMLQNVQREGFDQLPQQDTVSPQLDVLQQQLQRQLEVQENCIKLLGQISDFLQQLPTSSDLQRWHTLSEQHQQSLQKTGVSREGRRLMGERNPCPYVIIPNTSRLRAHERGT